MYRIIERIVGNKTHIITASIMIAGIFVFIVLPALPDIGGDAGVSIRAQFSLADSDGGGSAGGGSDGGGSSGGGSDGGGSVGGGSDGGGSAGGPSDPGTGNGGPNDSTPTPIPAPTCTLSVSPESVAQGGKAKLTWTTTNATQVSIDNAIGSVDLSGSWNVSPKYATTYTLTAKGEGGTVTCSDELGIIMPPKLYCALQINKTINKTTAKVGDLLTYNLSFKNVGTSDCTGPVKVVDHLSSDLEYVSETHSSNISAGYNTTPVYAGGSMYFDAGTLIPGEQGGLDIVVKVKPRAQCGDFSIENQGKITGAELDNFANWMMSNIVKTDIDNDCPPPVTPAPTCTLTASPTTVTGGNSSTLTWTTTNASSVSVNNDIGSVAVSGNRSVTPTTNTTYTLTATNASGASVTCSQAIAVTTTPPPTPQAPTCSLSANPTTIVSGNSSTLTWSTTNAVGVTLSNGSQGGNASLSGSSVVAPTSNTTYTLVATAQSGATVTCTAAITVNPKPPTGGGGDPKKCDMSIVKSVNKSTATIGEEITYTLDVKNIGTANCTGGGVRIADHLPTELSFVRAAGRGDVSLGYDASLPLNPTGTNSVYFNAHTLTPGESVSVDIVAKVKPRAQCGNFSFSNQGKVTAYELNNFGTWIVSTSVPVSVTNVCPPPPSPATPVCTLDASPSTITRGGNATLAWTTQNASSVSIDTGIGSVSATGTKSVSPTGNTTYTLTATGNGTTVTCVKTVTVNEPEPDPVVSCDAFTANPGTLTSAGTTTLTWATTNATNVVIDTGVGTVTEDGSKAVFVGSNTTFTLTATRGSQSKTCTVPVTIVPNVVVPKCDAFTASPNSVREGNSVTLSWNTTDATAVSINSGVGTVDQDGSKTVTPGSDTTYILTATNGSAQTTCQVSVNVDEDNGGGGGGGSSSPRCTLKASDESVKPGEKVTLTWKNLRTNEILLKDNRGTILIDTTKSADDRKYDEDEGTFVVEPTKSTSYTLSAIKGSKKKTCTVDIKVEGVTVTSTRSNEPLVAGISLSRLPYTGFDAGPLLTTVFYTLLGLWALFVAYVLVIRKSVVASATGKGTIVSDMPKPKLLEPQAVMPVTNNSQVTAPEVSRMGYVPSLMTAPRVIPSHSMTSSHAPVGYDAYYESYEEVPEVKEEVSADIPNLPVGNMPEFGVAPVAHALPINVDALESRAHEAYVLMSTDALNFIAGQSTNDAEATELLDTVIGAAKASFPKEDGWVVVNKDKIMSLLK